MEAKEITSEILDKNGFLNAIKGQYTLPRIGGNLSACVILVTIEGMPSANGKWMVAIKNGYTDAKIAITYVHELQQALTLCGVDKKIEV